MATKKELEAQDQKAAADYADAWGADTPPQAEATEDQAFGITPPAEAGAGAAAEGAGAAGDGKAADTPMAEAGAGGAGAPAGDAAAGADAGKGAAAGEPAAGAGDAGSAGDKPGAGDADKEAQRLRSWEGRLRAEAKRLADSGGKDIKADGEDGGAPDPKAEAGAAALDKVADDAESKGKTDLAQKAGAAADAIEDGSMTYEEAMKSLGEDFGVPFIQMIRAVATKVAQEIATKEAGGKVEPLTKTIDDLIGHITDTAQREHFEKINDAHGDFDDIRGKPEFAAFVEAYPDGTKIRDGGTARQINKLLAAFKDSTKGTEPEAGKEAAGVSGGDKSAGAPATDKTPQSGDADNNLSAAALDAAAGVRSSAGGMRLPDAPAKNDTYEGAWAEAS